VFVLQGAGSRLPALLLAVCCWQDGAGRPHTPAMLLLPLLLCADAGLWCCLLPQDLYVGLTPYSAPAVFGLLAGTELTDGVWYPLGGFGKVGDKCSG
jgi:hypothetical protein